ncbi:hypothetical protein ACOACO_08610 [Nocardioides sp. CPCC 205120]|uniref:hypothetical protein n=1 Tax=Nocardioides sp. CPCC 205120 TaxID=3406462 RepID=UPI003B50EF61
MHPPPYQPKQPSQQPHQPQPQQPPPPTPYAQQPPQRGYAPQPHPQHDPQQAYPPAWLDLHVAGSRWTSALNGPRATVNGERIPVDFGANRVPIAPGNVQVDCYLNWIFEQGRASIRFQCRPGDVVPVYYAPTFIAFAKSRIAHVPQERPGLVWFVLLMALLLPLTAFNLWNLFR